jgi:hypothetical protein
MNGDCFDEYARHPTDCSIVLVFRRSFAGESAAQRDVFQMRLPSQEAVSQKCIEMNIAQDCIKRDSGEIGKYEE